MSSRSKYIYFLQVTGGGPIKIGCSWMPQNRLLEIACWSPYPLEMLASVPGGLASEGFLHRKFVADRIHGEWFNPSVELLAEIDSAKATGQINGLLDDAEEQYDRKRVARNFSRILQLHHINEQDVAEFFGVTRNTVRRWSYWFPVTKIGHVIKYFESTGVYVTEADLTLERRLDRMTGAFGA